MVELPIGTVTLFFSDVEGSTQLVQQHGDGYGQVLDAFRRVLRTEVAAAGGLEVDCRADELFGVFQRAKDAVTAAVGAQKALAALAWPEAGALRVRMGLHTGEPVAEEGAYLGLDVNRAARICSAGHGGQILLSQATQVLMADAEVKDLGVYTLSGMPHEERLFQLVAPGLRSHFPPLRIDAKTNRWSFGRVLAHLRRRDRSPTLEESAWQVRALMPGIEPELRKPLADLGAALFTADRAAAGAARFVDRIDRRSVETRLAEQLEMAVVSPRAEEEAEALEDRLASIDRLVRCRRTADELAAGLAEELPVLRTSESIGRLRERVLTTTTELDTALERAAAELDPLSFKLRRTRWRGIYRSGRLYVVPFIDELGIDRRREFPSLAAAHNFAVALEISRKAKTEYAGAPHQDTDYGGPGGGW